jgi:hypothetical protein
MDNWFNNCSTLDEIRKQYHKLAMRWHPDLGGDTATMQDINSAYTQCTQTAVRLDNKFNWEKQYSSREAWWAASDEMSERIRQTIEKLVKLHGIQIELCGTWIWVSGNTRPVKETLKEYGLKWSHDKEKWYWVGYKSSSFRKFTMDEIRQLHGSVILKTEEADTVALPA